MILKGQKRKLLLEDEEVPDRSSPSWESQRQFVFSVSMSKYQRSQELPEPSLRRSVLIANTLRQINLETSGPSSVEGQAPPQEQKSIFSAVKHDAVVHGGHSAPASCPVNESSVPMAVEDDEDWGSMSTDADFALSAAISSILTALDSTIDGGAPAAPRTPLRSLENLSSDGGVSGVKPGAACHGVGWEQQQQEEQCREWESSMEVMRSSYLSDLTVEDLFQDIDTSLLERDMGGLGFRSSGAEFPAGDDLLQYLPSFPPPSSSPSHHFSVSLNPSLKCLPSFSSFSSLSSPSSPSSSSFSSQNHVRDGFELDHLMEILVES